MIGKFIFYVVFMASKQKCVSIESFKENVEAFAECKLDHFFYSTLMNSNDFTSTIKRNFSRDFSIHTIKSKGRNFNIANKTCDTADLILRMINYQGDNSCFKTDLHNYKRFSETQWFPKNVTLASVIRVHLKLVFEIMVDESVDVDHIATFFHHQ
uniref:DUF4371 domain-containing protein n=1 Tax=Rhabditophanes sp. KR3021 TaxID=114890 RepID=A0AC35TXV1_9BILA